jgi:hypothetical protein
MTTQIAPPVQLRGIEPTDGDEVARIVTRRFAGIHDYHRFERDFPTLDAAVELTTNLIAHELQEGPNGRVPCTGPERAKRPPEPAQPYGASGGHAVQVGQQLHGTGEDLLRGKLERLLEVAVDAEFEVGRRQSAALDVCIEPEAGHWAPACTRWPGG